MEETPLQTSLIELGNFLEAPPPLLEGEFAMLERLAQCQALVEEKDFVRKSPAFPATYLLLNAIFYSPTDKEAFAAAYERARSTEARVYPTRATGGPSFHSDLTALNLLCRRAARERAARIDAFRALCVETQLVRYSTAEASTEFALAAASYLMLRSDVHLGLSNTSDLDEIYMEPKDRARFAATQYEDPGVRYPPGAAPRPTSRWRPRSACSPEDLANAHALEQAHPILRLLQGMFDMPHLVALALVGRDSSTTVAAQDAGRNLVEICSGALSTALSETSLMWLELENPSRAYDLMAPLYFSVTEQLRAYVVPFPQDDPSGEAFARIATLSFTERRPREPFNLSLLLLTAFQLTIMAVGLATLGPLGAAGVAILCLSVDIVIVISEDIPDLFQSLRISDAAEAEALLQRLEPSLQKMETDESAFWTISFFAFSIGCMALDIGGATQMVRALPGSSTKGLSRSILRRSNLERTPEPVTISESITPGDDVSRYAESAMDLSRPISPTNLDNGLSDAARYGSDGQGAIADGVHPGAVGSRRTRTWEGKNSGVSLHRSEAATSPANGGRSATSPPGSDVESAPGTGRVDVESSEQLAAAAVLPSNGADIPLEWQPAWAARYLHLNPNGKITNAPDTLPSRLRELQAQGGSFTRHASSGNLLHKGRRVFPDFTTQSNAAAGPTVDAVNRVAADRLLDDLFGDFALVGTASDGLPVPPIPILDLTEELTSRAGSLGPTVAHGPVLSFIENGGRLVRMPKRGVEKYRAAAEAGESTLRKRLWSDVRQQYAGMEIPGATLSNLYGDFLQELGQKRRAVSWRDKLGFGTATHQTKICMPTGPASIRPS